MTINGVDNVLLGPFIGGDEAKIVCIREGDDLLVIDGISKSVFHALEGLQDGIKDHEKDNGAKRISLQNSSFK